MTSKPNRRGILRALVVGCSAVMVAALCLGAYTFHRLNRLVEDTPQESASGVSGNQQEGAPYPADMEHLDQILSPKRCSRSINKACHQLCQGVSWRMGVCHRLHCHRFFHTRLRH